MDKIEYYITYREYKSKQRRTMKKIMYVVVPIGVFALFYGYYYLSWVGLVIMALIAIVMLVPFMFPRPDRADLKVEISDEGLKFIRKRKIKLYPWKMFYKYLPENEYAKIMSEIPVLSSRQQKIVDDITDTKKESFGETFYLFWRDKSLEHITDHLILPAEPENQAQVENFLKKYIHK